MDDNSNEVELQSSDEEIENQKKKGEEEEDVSVSDSDSDDEEDDSDDDEEEEEEESESDSDSDSDEEEDSDDEDSDEEEEEDDSDSETDDNNENSNDDDDDEDSDEESDEKEEEVLKIDSKQEVEDTIESIVDEHDKKEKEHNKNTGDGEKDQQCDEKGLQQQQQQSQEEVEEEKVGDDHYLAQFPIKIESKEEEDEEEDMGDDNLAPLPVNLAGNKMQAQTGGRWKAILGSSAWRNYRRSRRQSLRKGNKVIDDDDAYDEIRRESLSAFVKDQGNNDIEDNALEEKSLKQWTAILNQARLQEETSHGISEVSSEDYNDTVGNSGMSLAQRLVDKNGDTTSNATSSVTGDDEVSNSGTSLAQRLLEKNGTNPPELASKTSLASRTNTDYESSYLFAEVEALERLLDEQEDEIDELEDELTRCKKKNSSLSEDFSKKQRSLGHLENKYAKLKVDLADAQSNESDLQLELAQLVMVRDLEVINLTNEFNQLVAYMKRLEKEREVIVDKLGRAEKSTEQKETKLLHALEELIVLKRGRNETMDRADSTRKEMFSDEFSNSDDSDDDSI